MSEGQLKWWGNRYSVRVRFADGSRKWVALPEGTSHADAKRRAKEIADIARVGSLPDVRAIAMPGESVAQWSERWTMWRVERGLESVRDDRSRLRRHILPLIGRRPMNGVTALQIEDVRDALDEKVRAGMLSWRTAQHVWTTVRSMFRDARTAKRRDLRVRDDDPLHGLAPPDRGAAKSKQFLYPSELATLLACESVPLRWRRVFALSTYLLVRAAELEALGWDDVDLDRGVVHVHRSLRRYSREEKTTKTGDNRRFAIEPTLMPLMRALHAESGGRGRVLGETRMPNKFELSKALRLYLAVAEVGRDELFINDATRKWITFHDLRATGITWMAVRGDDPLKIKQRAGHASLSTTEGYIRLAEELRAEFGGVFPPLPRSVSAVNKPDAAAIAAVSDA
jgi:integrase